jgi:transcriptional regulator with XRE-family HTH domain
MVKIKTTSSPEKSPRDEVPNYSKMIQELLKIEFAGYLEKVLVSRIVINPRMSEIQFADWLGISPQQLSQFLNRQRLPGILALQRMAEQLGPIVYYHAGAIKPLDGGQKLVNCCWPGLTEERRERMLAIAHEQYPELPLYVSPNPNKE